MNNPEKFRLIIMLFFVLAGGVMKRLHWLLPHSMLTGWQLIRLLSAGKANQGLIEPVGMSLSL